MPFLRRRGYEVVEFDALGRLTRVDTTVTDPEDGSSETETEIYTYDCP